MALLFCGNGEIVALSLIVNKVTATENLVLKLFTNNHTPVAGDTAGTYTEASGFGYAAVTLTGASWSVSGSGPATASYAQQTFTFTGGLGNVYGYYMIRASSTDLIYAERFASAPFLISNNGDQIKITPQVTGT
jgi:hypothetical protein